jgi:uncharacterized protein YecA (UPF0149 family)
MPPQTLPTTASDIQKAALRHYETEFAWCTAPDLTDAPQIQERDVLAAHSQFLARRIHDSQHPLSKEILSLPQLKASERLMQAISWDTLIQATRCVAGMNSPQQGVTMSKELLDGFAASGDYICEPKNPLYARAEFLRNPSGEISEFRSYKLRVPERSALKKLSQLPSEVLFPLELFQPAVQLREYKLETRRELLQILSHPDLCEAEKRKQMIETIVEACLNDLQQDESTFLNAVKSLLTTLRSADNDKKVLLDGWDSIPHSTESDMKKILSEVRAMHSRGPDESKKARLIIENFVLEAVLSDTHENLLRDILDQWKMFTGTQQEPDCRNPRLGLELSALLAKYVKLEPDVLDDTSATGIKKFDNIRTMLYLPEDRQSV